MLDTNTAQQHGGTAGSSTLLIVDDDERFRDRLARAMERRGYVTRAAGSVQAALVEVTRNPPEFAVVDLRLDDGSGLDVVEALNTTSPDTRALVLSGYANIPTAVAAVKLGAIDYLAKPTTADDIEAVLRAKPGTLPSPPVAPPSPDAVKAHHILQVFEQSDQNVSETARQLSMHRRTLQRLLSRISPQRRQ